MKILGIDPGSRNLGLGAIDTKSKLLLHASTEDMGNNDMESCLVWVAEFIKQDKYKIFDCKLCVIENQVLGMKLTNYVNHGIAVAFYTILTFKGVRCMFIQPNKKFTVFKQFSPSYVPKVGQKRLTAGQRRNRTKTMSIKLATHACKTLWDINYTPNTDHEADCIGMIATVCSIE